ncbi:MAG: diaminopimelate epimerase [Woeseia sp.]
MHLQFTKMEGTGNDFIVLDARRAPIDLRASQIAALADRRTGIGFDQLLMIEPPRDPAHAIAYRIYNADGGEVQQCGNGARALAAWVSHTDGKQNELYMESASGLVTARIQPDVMVSVDMGIPDFDPQALPFLAPARAREYVLDINARSIEFGAVSMGNPHAVVPVDDLDQVDVAQIGAGMQQHPAFPESVNVGFMQVLSNTEMRLRVFERGVGETLACGTGACAAMAVAQTLGLVGPEVLIRARGGELLVTWAGDGQNTWLTGPCTRVFEGNIDV